MIFGLRGNINKPQIAEVVNNLLRFLDRKKINYILEEKIAELVSGKFGKKFAKGTVVSDHQITEKSGCIISIGGDGTFLSSAKLVGESGIPIIGVNLGKLGFLAETSISEIPEFISAVLKGNFKTEEHTVITASSTDRPRRKLFALNEIVIGQTGIVKTIALDAYYNNQLINSYLADGLIISTPTGSTAYSLSAGGPIVVPVSDVLILVPLSPHTLTARPVIFPDSGKLRIKAFAKKSIVVTADGQTSLSPGKDAEIVVTLADYKIKVLKSLSSNYFKVLNRKLFWGRDVRKPSDNPGSLNE
jgi:NAD+ kinase